MFYFYCRKTLFLLFIGLSFFAQAQENKKVTKVGFQLLSQNRNSTEWDSLLSTKTVHAYFWYPAKAPKKEKSMPYSVYIQAINPENKAEKNEASFIRVLSSFSVEDSISRKEVKNYLQRKSKLIQNASLFSNTLPLIVISGAHPIYFLDLAESLAKEGFPVLSLPRKGIKKGQRLPFSQEEAQEFQKDLDIMVQYVRKHFKINNPRLAFISWSFEGVPTLEYALRQESCLFLSLDSSLGYAYGKRLQSLELAAYKDLSFPILHFSHPESTNGKDLSFLQALPNTNIIDTIPLSHGQFTSIASISIPKLKGKQASKAYINLMGQVKTQLNRCKH